MLSYRHAFHAGNHADVLKHFVEIQLLRHLSQKDKAFWYIDTHAGAETPYKKLKYRAMAIGVKTIGTRPFLPAISKLMFGITTRRRDPELVKVWEERFASVDVPSMLLGLRALVRRDSVVDRLRSIEIPSLVIVGDEDVSLPVTCSKEIADSLPNSSLVVIPESGHLSSLEQPEAVTKAMQRFLGSVN